MSFAPPPLAAAPSGETEGALGEDQGSDFDCHDLKPQLSQIRRSYSPPLRDSDSDDSADYMSEDEAPEEPLSHAKAVLGIQVISSWAMSNLRLLREKNGWTVTSNFVKAPPGQTAPKARVRSDSSWCNGLGQRSWKVNRRPRQRAARSRDSVSVDLPHTYLPFKMLLFELPAQMQQCE